MKTKIWAAAAALAVSTSLVACSGPNEPATITVRGVVLGTVGNPGQIKDGRYCEFTDGRVSVGDALVLKGADGTILGKANLTAEKMQFAVCTFGFEFSSVKAGQTGYSFELGSFDPVVATEDEIKSDKLSLDIRGPMDVLMKPERKPITLSTD